MVKSCSAYGCKNRWDSRNKRQYHNFPLGDPMLLTRWIAAVGRASWMPTRTSYLCSDHFTKDSYKSEARKYLRKNAVPTLFDFHGSKTSSVAKCSVTEHPYITRITPCQESVSAVEEDNAACASNSSNNCMEVSPDICNVSEDENINNNCTVTSESSVANEEKSPSKCILMRQIKILQRKLKQRDEKIKNLQILLNATLDGMTDDEISGMCSQLPFRQLLFNSAVKQFNIEE
ncbi:THAP domain-containing protein 1-like [Uloborus diversus]|uniref:THAP domain-containing protein 1-like n=1 Tax=Uloborus diversus TaxID=327109 RepID=UPI00240A200E|nr:THAP domain-containing protein 1-like [Uloborus diversus]